MLTGKFMDTVFQIVADNVQVNGVDYSLVTEAEGNPDYIDTDVW